MCVCACVFLCSCKWIWFQRYVLGPFESLSMISGEGRRPPTCSLPTERKCTTLYYQLCLCQKIENNSLSFSFPFSLSLSCFMSNVFLFLTSLCFSFSLHLFEICQLKLVHLIFLYAHFNLFSIYLNFYKVVCVYNTQIWLRVIKATNQGLQG